MISDDCQDALFVCLPFFNGHHWFHVVFFVCKGSNNREAGGL